MRKTLTRTSVYSRNATLRLNSHEYKETDRDDDTTKRQLDSQVMPTEEDLCLLQQEDAKVEGQEEPDIKMPDTALVVDKDDASAEKNDARSEKKKVNIRGGKITFSKGSNKDSVNLL